jgi:hypothetical protein
MVGFIKRHMDERAAPADCSAGMSKGKPIWGLKYEKMLITPGNVFIKKTPCSNVKTQLSFRQKNKTTVFGSPVGAV